MAISLSKNGNAVKFDFDDNSHYLNDGTIEVPVNSLTLVTDESNMFTFKKAASDDIFISGLYSEIGMSKAELIAWYKDNMVGSTGGGGGVTSGEVQTMIDESVSGLSDDISTVSGDVSTLSGAVDSNHNAITALNGDVSSLSGDVANKADTTAVTASINAAVSGKMDTSVFNTYSASTDARISEDEEVTSAALNALDDALDDKADTSAVTESINAAVSGKQDTLIAGTNITISGNVISAEGGGKAIVAGRGIAITTGATADTVSFNLPIWTNQYNNSVAEGDSRNNASFYFSHAEGNSTEAHYGAHSEGTNTKALGYYSHAEGQSATASGQSSHAEGISTITNNNGEHASGMHNVSHTGSTDADKTLFSVGNGTAENARHNAFEIRQNGDIYITKDGSDVKLQDQLGGGGGSSYTAGDGIDITNDVISVTGKVDTSAITSSVTSASTDSQVPSAKAVYDALQGGGGNNVIELTQAQYDALTDIDPTAFYIITDAQSLEARLAEDEEVTAAALNELNNTIGDINTILQSI